MARVIAHDVTEADLARTGPATLAVRYLRCFWTPIMEERNESSTGVRIS